MVDILIAVAAITVVIFAVVKQIKLYKNQKSTSICTGECYACKKIAINKAKSSWTLALQVYVISCLC